MDNNNIGGMNPQQFSQNTPQTSQPHMGMSGIELQKMQQEAEQRRREQSRRNADFFGRLPRIRWMPALNSCRKCESNIIVSMIPLLLRPDRLSLYWL